MSKVYTFDKLREKVGRDTDRLRRRGEANWGVWSGKWAKWKEYAGKLVIQSGLLSKFRYRVADWSSLAIMADGVPILLRRLARLVDDRYLNVVLAPNVDLRIIHTKKPFFVIRGHDCERFVRLVTRLGLRISAHTEKMRVSRKIKKLETDIEKELEHTEFLRSLERIAPCRKRRKAARTTKTRSRPKKK